jgi:uncharacterized membrane protein
MEHTRGWVELASQGLEILAVAIMVGFILVGTGDGLVGFTRKRAGTYTRYRVALARTIQIGLELLVAADIIRTVSTPLTETNLVLLSGLVVTRTFLGWTLTVEIEGHWPWQAGKESGPEQAPAAEPAEDQKRRELTHTGSGDAIL